MSTAVSLHPHRDIVAALRHRVRWWVLLYRPQRDPVGRSFRPRRPASVRQVESEEARLGFSLPDLLRRIYLSVANGGFGPGYGVIGVEGGFTDDLGQTVGILHERWREPDPSDPSYAWPAGHLPICHWGCAVYSVVDCTRAENPVYFWDPGLREEGAPMGTAVKPHKPSLEAWLQSWLNGEDLWMNPGIQPTPR
jgi:SMI1 / KNR4 family (SUKH-1)